MDSYRINRTKCHGFTLIELLVVIALIGVMVAIILPSLSGARLRAMRSQVMANMRGMVHGFSSYAVDNKGTLPMGNRSNSMVQSTSAGYFYSTAHSINYLPMLIQYNLIPATRHPIASWPDITKMTGTQRAWVYHYWPGYRVTDKPATAVLTAPTRLDKAGPGQVMFSEILEYRGDTGLYWHVEPVSPMGRNLVNAAGWELFQSPRAMVLGTHIGGFDGAVRLKRFDDVTNWLDRLGTGSTGFKLPSLQP